MARVFVIGGPNGAGKTTSATGSLPELLDCAEFVNADAIAKALSPFASERAAYKAGRIMLRELGDMARSQRDFAFETTMASRTFAPFLQQCRRNGYEVRLVFLWLESVKLAKTRVAKRVRSGGHGIPKDVIERRYRAGVRNFLQLYLPLADQWVVYDNSGAEPRLVARSAEPGRIELLDPETWARIEAAAK